MPFTFVSEHCKMVHWDLDQLGTVDMRLQNGKRRNKFTMISFSVIAWVCGLQSAAAFVQIRIRHRSDVGSLDLAKDTATQPVKILEEVGSGSYGTVHLLELDYGDDIYIGKRAWGLGDLRQMLPRLDNQQLREKAQRCQTYWEAEKHCFQRLKDVHGVPNLETIIKDDDGHSWMVFELLTHDGKTAKSLDDWISLDLLDHQKDQSHHLYLLSKALKIPGENQEDGNDSTLAETLDVFMIGLLQVLSNIHEKGIVHRDIKPSNVLVDNNGIKLIDFGSAADLSTAGPLKKNVGLSNDRVAISPIYSAPEVFIDASKRNEALNFDVFSAALMYCQLLFQYLDERTDAGFRQQLETAGWSLNSWLATELAGDFRPAGIEDALTTLSMRPGLFSLLQDMLNPYPWKRVNSATALKRYKRILDQSQMPSLESISTVDGPFLTDVLRSLDLCQLPPDDDEESLSSLIVRPLQFVASFRRGVPLGLLLAEADSLDMDDQFGDDNESRELWKRATLKASPGEVYVSGVVEGSQADELGIFQVGDRLDGVGELPVNKGFDSVVRMLNDDFSPDPNFITLHFDRQRTEVQENQAEMGTEQHPVKVLDQGAWTSRGRRKTQEDAYLLNEMHDSNDKSIILAGVADGHLGAAASHAVREQLPVFFMQELLLSAEQSLEKKLEEMLETAWNSVCDSYRSGCMGDDESDTCRVADYDSQEGRLSANTGSSQAVAGTTANFVALDTQTGRLAILNCGDSRSFGLVGKKLLFQSQDHKPENEIARFEKAIESDPNCLYEMPGCRFSRWYVIVGDYEYAVSRSLEGPFATTRGIVSDADLKVIESLPTEEPVSLLVATDGLWEVCDTEEIANVLYKLRFQEGRTASDAAKILCSRAIDKGSSDNVSCTVLYLS